MSCCLDQLPIEIFHQIFYHLWAHEILYSFHTINDYLNNIITHYDNYLINFESIRKSDFDHVCRHIRPNQVISLVLSDATETPNQFELFQSFFSIEQFTRLRALKLIDLNDNGSRFFFQLYQAQYLVSLEINVSIEFPLIGCSPSLRRLIINIPSGVYFDIEPAIDLISFEQLRYLSISNISCMMLKRIFSQANQLKSLGISFQFLNTIDSALLADIHQGQVTTPALVSLSLNIVAAIQVITRAHIERFLVSFHRLRQLELVVTIGADPPFVDAYQWERFIVEYLPQLITFYFKFSSLYINQNILNQFRSSFWLNKRWVVACNLDGRCLFTVPHFAPTSMSNACAPVSSECTTLPVEEHIVLYDRVTQLVYESDHWNLPYRYNHVKKLFLDDPYMQENIVDLSQVQSLYVNTSDWSLYMILTLIKEDMSSVNYLSLNCTYTNIDYQDFPNISLPQIQMLCLPKYGQYLDNDRLHLTQFFPCVERLKVSINSKHQIPFLIDHFKNILSGFFYVNPSEYDGIKRIRMTRQWLKKQTDRLRGSNRDNFICQIDDKCFFRVSIWIGDNDEVDHKVQRVVRRKPWWHQRFRWHSVK
ncbi:unnamed protein product [Rotaria magnacalcarata]